MKNEGNILDQLYHQVNVQFGSRRNDESFCMVLHNEALERDMSFSVMRQNIQEDLLTNCFCAPYQLVNRVMPTTLSRRYQYILSLWLCKRPLSFNEKERKLFESETMYFTKMKKQLEGFSIEKQEDEQTDWKESYGSLYTFTTDIVQHMQRCENPQESLGERELQDARQLLKDMRLLLPQQSYIYPVVLYPNDWRSSLSTSFHHLDLVPSLSESIYQLLKLMEQREYMIKQLLFYKEHMDGLQQFQTIRRTFLAQMIQTMPSACDAHDRQVLFQLSISIENPEHLCSSFYRIIQRFLHQKQSSKNLREFLMHGKKSREQYETSYQELCYASTQNLVIMDLLRHLHEMNEQFQKLSSLVASANQKSLYKQKKEDELLPKNIPVNYEPVVLKSTIEQLYQSDLYCEKGVELGLSLLFGNATPFGIDEERMKKVSMELGCLITQIEIKRPWFNETVFDFSVAYDRLSETPISHGGTSLKQKKRDLLPSFPIRMVVVKDLSLRFHFQKAKSMLAIVKQYANYGNGFLCFHEGRRNDDVSVDQDGDILTIRYPKAYILGYFMKFTPKDESRYAQGGS